jgi:hypothetical protein
MEAAAGTCGDGWSAESTFAASSLWLSLGIRFLSASKKLHEKFYSNRSQIAVEGL